MASAGGAYVVRDDGAGGVPGSTGQGNTGQANVDKLFPYTLKGLTDALEEARFRSFAGPPQVVMVMKEGSLRVIRRYEQGRERPAGDAPG
jgi:hypothetical protein